MTLSLNLWEPDEEDLRSFLPLFRRLVAQGEPIYVRRIYNLCYCVIALAQDELLRDHSVYWCNTWRRTERETMIGIQFQGAAMRPEELADLWINGYYFHNDIEKHERLLDDLTAARANFQKPI